MLVCGPTALGFRELLKPGAQVRDGAWKSAELVGLRSRLLIRHVALVDCGHLQAKNRLVLKLLRPTGMYIGSPETTRRRAQRDSAGMRREECGIACRVELCSDGMWEGAGATLVTHHRCRRYCYCKGPCELVLVLRAPSWVEKVATYLLQKKPIPPLFVFESSEMAEQTRRRKRCSLGSWLWRGRRILTCITSPILVECVDLSRRQDIE